VDRSVVVCVTHGVMIRDEPRKCYHCEVCDIRVTDEQIRRDRVPRGIAIAKRTEADKPASPGAPA
jgi:hypothetical protein